MPLSLAVTGDGFSYQYSRHIEFEIVLLGASIAAPLGPDAYGYYAYDRADSAYGPAPGLRLVRHRAAGTREHHRRDNRSGRRRDDHGAVRRHPILRPAPRPHHGQLERIPRTGHDRLQVRRQLTDTGRARAAEHGRAVLGRPRPVGRRRHLLVEGRRQPPPHLPVRRGPHLGHVQHADVPGDLLRSRTTTRRRPTTRRSCSCTRPCRCRTDARSGSRT